MEKEQKDEDEKNWLKKLEKDNDAILNMSPKDLKTYQEKRKKEFADLLIRIEKKEKDRKTRTKARLKKIQAKQKTNKEDIK